MKTMLCLAGVLILLFNTHVLPKSALAQQATYAAQPAAGRRSSGGQPQTSDSDSILASAVHVYDLKEQIGFSNTPGRVVLSDTPPILAGALVSSSFETPLVPISIIKDTAANPISVQTHHANLTGRPAPVEIRLAASETDAPRSATDVSPSTVSTPSAQIIENILFANNNAPASPCSNSGPNVFGYTPPYDDVLFTDPQWGGVYQKMIRNVSGGASDHNLYYWRNSFNANGTLMLGIQSPQSSDGTAQPWIVALFDGDGCFLKPLYVAAGASGDIFSFNWRASWSRTDPNVF
jgi:hypothetical protein